MWIISTMFNLDPHITQCDKDVRRILDMQSVAQNMPATFSDLAKVMRSHIHSKCAYKGRHPHRAQSQC